jgi:hypothetical protein
VTEKQEETNPDNVVTALRQDMVPASDAHPARESIFKRIHLRKATGILLGVIIVLFMLYIGIGPGRPVLEQGLANLADSTLTPTNTLSATVISPTHSTIAPTRTPLPATQTVSPSPTHRLTNTPVVYTAGKATPTAPPAKATEPACREATSITSADAGKTLCVRGTVISTLDHPSGFMVIFSTQPGAFYWISYDLVWSQVKLDTCYQVTGKIYQVGVSPILVFDYHNIPEVCP